MSLEDIVDVNITREDTPVSREGFGTQLILGTNKVFNERVAFYESLSELTTAGFATTDFEYIAAEKAFSQNPRSPLIAIGRRTVNNVVITVSTVIDSTDYFCKINDTEFLINSGVAATDLTIATALVDAINLGSEPVTAIDNTDGTYDLDADVAGVAYSVSIDANQTITKPYTASDAIDDDSDAVKNENNDWWGLAETSHVKADQILLAAWAEANEKLYVTSSLEAEIIDVSEALDTTSLAYMLKASSYARTALMYHQDPTTFPECAWLGKQLPTQPGTTNWMFKTLAGIEVSTLSATQIANAKAKSCNMYITIAAVNMTQEGVVSANEYIDIIRGVDWLKATMQEDIFSLLVNSPKVPFTNAGITHVEAVVRANVQAGIDTDFLTNDTPPTYVVPKVSDVDPVDKANRLLKGIEFTAEAAGAINKIIINGTVTVF